MTHVADFVLAGEQVFLFFIFFIFFFILTLCTYPLLLASHLFAKPQPAAVLSSCKSYKQDVTAGKQALTCCIHLRQYPHQADQRLPLQGDA